jgi:hypothetical protein
MMVVENLELDYCTRCYRQVYIGKIKKPKKETKQPIRGMSSNESRDRVGWVESKRRRRSAESLQSIQKEEIRFDQQRPRPATWRASCWCMSGCGQRRLMVWVTKRPEKETDAEKPREKGMRKEKQRKRQPTTMTGPMTECEPVSLRCWYLTWGRYLDCMATSLQELPEVRLLAMTMVF